MSKRKIICTLLISAVITIFALTTNTLLYILEGMVYLFLILTVLTGCLELLLIVSIKLFVNKLYKELRKSFEEIEIAKKLKYKAYFEYSGEKLEQKIKGYDEYIKEENDFNKKIIKIVKEYERYVSKEKMQKVLEIEQKLIIRKPDED